MSRNPYQVEDKEPELRDSVFVLMDILGYSEMIRQSEKTGTQQQVLRKLHRTLSGGRAWLEDLELSAQMKGLYKKDQYALKAFTDNIVIGWPVHDDAESEFGSAFFKLAIFRFIWPWKAFLLEGPFRSGQRISTT